MSTLTTTPADLAPHKSRKRRTRRRIAKGLAYVSLAVTAVLVLSEPWLLLPVLTFVIALSLWD
ncbi:hypothetical protein Ade02nite_89820 [Paractinoplanes deccanensis]|uniref:Phosphatidate cytidylyltransferase n=1 Tax=Paractinoplanes deccanensis TaxID=113561 RepID=A0ABQ3YK06_9ACTN|nr:hypothetical protein [Actinoplanes deccanensis]GID80341.1 hypothetical protein Ade02nite_89820 [Actinoplanes deccanensis]